MTWDINSYRTNVGCHRFRIRTVPRVARPSTLNSVPFIAERFGHLDFQAPPQHVSHQVGEQSALASQRDCLGPGLFNQAGSSVVQRPDATVRHRQIRRHIVPNSSFRHERNPFEPTACSLGRSNHAGYTNFLTDPTLEDLAHGAWGAFSPVIRDMYRHLGVNMWLRRNLRRLYVSAWAPIFRGVWWSHF